MPLRAVVELAESEPIDEASFAHFDREDAAALVAEVEGLLGRLTRESLLLKRPGL